MSRPHLLSDQDLQGRPGEHLLFEALIARLLADIAHRSPTPAGHKRAGGTPTIADQLGAIEAILDEDGGVVQWAELLGIDGSAVREQLLREAGLGDLAQQQQANEGKHRACSMNSSPMSD